MPEPDIVTDLRAIGRTRDTLTSHDRAVEDLRVARAALLTTRDTLVAAGAEGPAADLGRRIERLDADLLAGRERRAQLLDEIGELSDRLLRARGPEALVATLDGRRPVAMLPVRLETRFETATKLLVRVFPDQLHIDVHDPALTVDESAGARWYWNERWQAGLDDADAARAAWRGLTSRFRPGRASYLVSVMTPTNTRADGDPTFPEIPARESTWSRSPVARALPDRFCVVGLDSQDGAWVERFRQWGTFLPDELPVAPSPRDLSKPEEEGGLPGDEGTRWLREPARAKEQGVLIEIEHPSLAAGVDRLVVLGVDWTQLPDRSAASIGSLLDAQRYGGHLGFVSQGTPTNNTSQSRAGFTSDPDAEAAALDPFSSPPPAPAHEWSAGRRLAGALGLEPGSLDGLPGADSREHAWASALTDVLWRGTAGYYLTDLLDPLAKDDPQVDANLREFTRRNVFAAGPLPVLRVGAQPYGVLPVVASRRYEPGPDQATRLVHRVASLMRDIVTPAVADVPHLRRAGEDQDVDTVLLALLQRTPVPWTFRFRPITGPIQRKNMSLRWDLINAWQRSWTSAMWVGLGVFRTTRLNELTHGKDHPLPVPLVLKPDQQNPTGYLGEIADLTKDLNGRKALNLRENSNALLEALAAHSAVLELDRCALQVTRDRLALSTDALATLPALNRLAIATPDMLRVETAPLVPVQALDFRSGRQLADAVVPGVSPRPLGELVTTEFAEKVTDLSGLLGAPADPFYWLAHNQLALRTLAEAPADQLEWAFRGYLDLFSTRLDAWFTGLATSRLAEHRASEPTGVHVGSWGFVENLRRDSGAAAESLGFVHTPSLAHAASTALLRNGRLANRGDDGAVFDLQITSERVRRALWLLDGVARGQRLAALLGYRVERGLRRSGLEMMRYQMPLRRTAPLRGPQAAPDEPVEVLAARDVVDGVALLDRWREDPAAVLAEVAAQAGLRSLPAGDAARLRAVIDDVHASYDAVSDLLVAESVHQAAVGNLDRSGAALSSHDRHGRAPELEYVATPRSGHTVAHRVAVVLQHQRLTAGWRRDARGAAEPLLDAWVGELLGSPQDWRFGARLRATDGTTTDLTPVSLADLGLGPLSVALATQRIGQARPSELEQRIGLAFAAQVAADPTAELELLADPPADAPAGGLALLCTLGDWVAKVAGSAPLGAGDFLSGADVSGGLPSPGAVDLPELAGRVDATLTRLTAALTSLDNATTNTRRSRGLLNAVPFDGPDALPRVPPNHPSATAELTVQADEVTARLRALVDAVAEVVTQPVPEAEDQAVARHLSVLRSMLGPAQPVLPRWTLAESAPVSASLTGRQGLVAGDPTAPAAWLHRSALVRPELDAFAGLMLHAEAGGSAVADQLSIVQLPHRPGVPWVALPFGELGAPPHGSLGLVLHSWRPFDPARAFAGVVVDAWTETIPADTDTTAVTFHYDAPGARAPQAVLLAVHPARDPTTWSFELLLDTVNEAADLARMRTLSAAELAPMGSFLPALYLPDDYTHDVPSVSIKDLLVKARAAGVVAQFADVLGKA
ncbi:MAG TPA: hypothetical protein VFG63_01725 [Nocardioidaceae bacterium]|nr:hypothetical protein [Nocardioidaceae bacterium]